MRECLGVSQLSIDSIDVDVHVTSVLMLAGRPNKVVLLCALSSSLILDIMFSEHSSINSPAMDGQRVLAINKVDKLLFLVTITG